MLESKIDSIKSNIENKQSEIDSFVYEISESDFDEFLDEIGQPVNVCGMKFYPSDILKSCDPIAYRCSKSDYESNIDLDDVAEYVDLKDELEVLESELEDLESELEDLQSELED
jgi:chaperonin cofactor prefoldin